jgi:hypothetical protein
MVIISFGLLVRIQNLLAGYPKIKRIYSHSHSSV